MMKIVDCFTFYNELKLLKFRLEYLYNLVDHFVIVEANLTHSGKSKPLFFDENKNMFSKYLDKIVHVVVSDMPTNTGYGIFKDKKNLTTTLVRENYQRNCIDRGINQLQLNDDDIIIISDCDEIPDRNTIKNINIEKVYALEQDLYYYNLTIKEREKWTQSKICNYGSYKYVKNPQLIRTTLGLDVISKGGWHFSYFGNEEFIMNKIRNFCHYNMFQDITSQKIKEKIDKGEFLVNLNFIKLSKIPIEENTYLPEGYELLN